MNVSVQQAKGKFTINQTVSILCSGMGLGVYIPSLLIHQQLSQRGIKSEIFVIEEYFKEDNLEKLKKNKKAFHDSFKVAVMGHKIAKGDIINNLKDNNINDLINNWEKEGRSKFIMMSGHWYKILENYINQVGQDDIIIEAVRMDNGVTPSWKNFKNEKRYFNEIWLFNKHLKYSITVNDKELIPFDKRQNRFLIHGGGWGMGTYQSKVKELNKKGLSLDIVAYRDNEIEDTYKENKYYLMDPDWSPWKRNNEGKYEFPYMYEIKEGKQRIPLKSKNYHAIYDVCMNCKGIISKPGGGTLLDSLDAGTPLIFIESIAKHEEANADLWVNLGFGVYYNQWVKSGFSIELLKKLHNNIINKRNDLIDYLDSFLEKS